MPWRPLRSASDELPPKLGNLAVAAQAGLATPPTWWTLARDAGEAGPAPEGLEGAAIVRSASPTEDGAEQSMAGQFHSEAVGDVRDTAELAGAVGRVTGSLPVDGGGVPRGCVFLQPLRRPERGGVAFFDGYYFECTTAPGGNVELTSGAARGEVVRGHLRRDDPWSDWLRAVRAAFPGPAALDVEFVQDGDAFELLQVRPAAFEVRRNRTLSQANHREIHGDRPSPWLVSVVVTAGRDATRFFAEVDPRIADWVEPYAVESLGRAWMNFGFFFRLMDHWGLPRTWVTEGVGGHALGPADARLLPSRMLRSVPTLVRLQLTSLRTVLRSRRGVAAFRREVEAARTVPELFRANVAGMELALRTNFALGGLLSGSTRLRRVLGISGRPRVVTAELMRAYDALRGLPASEREAGLDAWIETYGHRGPLESDPARPRFAELRSVLLDDLARPGAATDDAAPGRTSWAFALERRREAFRDDLMRVWRVLRRRLLAAGERHVADGKLDRAEDVFQLRAADLAEPASAWRERVARNRESAAAEHAVVAPTTADEDTLADLSRAKRASDADTPDGELSGIGLGGEPFTGTVRVVHDLTEALSDDDLGPDTVLVVAALEPSWALLFGRVGAVVSELGGELSHASILLREAGRTAVVDVAGATTRLRDGDRVRVSPRESSVTVLESPAS